ncbi:MAG: hypothetical protein U0229_15255 [Anaeromyxobacter sp.]
MPGGRAPGGIAPGGIGGRAPGGIAPGGRAAGMFGFEGGRRPGGGAAGRGAAAGAAGACGIGMFGLGAARAMPGAGAGAGFPVTSSFTLSMSAWLSKGLPMWPSAFAARARFSSNASNVPERRRTGIFASAGSAFTASQTS